MTAIADYRSSYTKSLTSRRSFVSLAAGGILAVAGLSRMQVLAAAGGYEAGKKIEGAYTFQYGTYVAPAKDELYQYAHDDKGDAYYNTYDGSAWSGWQAYENQPAPVAYDPAPVSYGDSSYVYYSGEDGYLYQQGWDSYGAATWDDISGDYTYTAAPYASVYEDAIHLYGNSGDGILYHKAYTETEGWDAWAPVNDPAAPTKSDSKPYAVSWADYDNVFWTGADGYAYWNRYSYAEKTWTGAKQIPSDYTFKGTPYAVGYAPETSLYAYGTTADGAPSYNVFDGSAWSGWTVIDAGWTASYQPNVYVYDDVQHVVYTSDDYHAYYTSYGADGWGEWQDLGGNYGYDTCQYAYADGLYLTYTGEDGSIYYRTYAFDGGATVEPTPTEKPGY